MSHLLRAALFAALAAAGPWACNNGESPIDGEPETGEPEPEPEPGPTVPADPNEVDLAGAGALYEALCQDDPEATGIESANPDTLFIYHVGDGALIAGEDNMVNVAVANLGLDRNVADWGVRVVGPGEMPMVYNPMVDEVVDGDDVELWSESWLSDFEFLPEDRFVDPCAHKVLRLEVRVTPDAAGPDGTTPVEVTVVDSSGSTHHRVTVDLPVTE